VLLPCHVAVLQNGLAWASQVPRILNPVVLVVDSLPKLCKDEKLEAYVKSLYGSVQACRCAGGGLGFTSVDQPAWHGHGTLLLLVCRHLDGRVVHCHSCIADSVAVAVRPGRTVAWYLLQKGDPGGLLPARI
jgi:hypothetical protein